MRLRLSRNGTAQRFRWQLTEPKPPHRRIVWAEGVLMENVDFETFGADGWAVGDVRSLLEMCHTNGERYQITDERLLALDNDRIGDLDVESWVPLTYVRHAGFQVYGVTVPGVQALLVAPGLMVCRP